MYHFFLFIITNVSLMDNGKILFTKVFVALKTEGVFLCFLYVYIIQYDTLFLCSGPTALTFVSCMHNMNGSQVNGGSPASCVIGTTLCQCSDGNTSGLHIDGIIQDIDTSNGPGLTSYLLFVKMKIMCE